MTSILVAQQPYGTNKGLLKQNEFIAKMASRLADPLNSTVDIVRIEKLPLATFEDTYVQAMRNRMIRSKRELDRFKVKAPTQFKRKVILDASICDGILSQAKADKSSLIVVGTQARRGLERLLKGSVAEEVIRRAKVPVLTVNPVAGRQKLKSLKHPKILFATDLGLNSRKAQRFAIELAKKLRAELIIFYNLYDISQTAAAVPFAPTEVSFDTRMWDQFRDQALRNMERLGKTIREKGVNCKLIVNQEPDSTSHALLNEVKALSPNLVIMGTHGRRFIPSVIMGTTARQVIASSPVPVITVKPK